MYKRRRPKLAFNERDASPVSSKSLVEAGSLNSKENYNIINGEVKIFIIILTDFNNCGTFFPKGLKLNTYWHL